TGFGGENNRVFFDMGAEAGQVQLDNISLTLASDDSGDDSGDSGDNAGSELLTNSSFDSSEGWGGTDGMAESIVDGVFTADVAVSGNPWDVSLKQNLTLIADTDYILSFDARSDDSRSVVAGLGLDQDPWTNVTETVMLSTEWTNYSINFTTTGFGGENNRVLFDMGAEAGQVQLDNVSLVLASADSDDSSDDSGSSEPTGLATIDFETVGNSFTWTTFENDSNPALEITANPAVDSVNDSANVAKITALAGGQPWVGVESAHGDFGPLTLDVNNSTVKIMVYKSVISDVGIKFAIANGGAQPEIKVSNTVVNQWEELTFDFSGYIGLTESIDIDQIIIFPDFDLAGRGQDNVVYFDNISFQ
ncbi:carbohydrate binding domain-containing protein, partial [Thalassotalea eurytherma]|uniref:carbohydrate binding domain-containing protein n=1 Tax=Thalassotalea eurytherma TaxID=1144278 RepID=UPI0024E1738F